MARHRPHLLVKPQDEDGTIRLDDEANHHLRKVLRFTEGEVSYTDGEGLTGIGRYRDGAVERGAEEMVSRPSELTVAVAPPHAANRVRFLVEKLAELAVAKLVWLQTARTEGRPPRPDKAKRWAAAALEQSRGAWLLEIGGPIRVEEVDKLGDVVFAEAGGTGVGALPTLVSPVLVVGPEGGFAAGEIPGGAPRIGLGSTVLRVETAAIAGSVLLRSVRSR